MIHRIDCCRTGRVLHPFNLVSVKYWRRSLLYILASSFISQAVAQYGKESTVALMRHTWWRCLRLTEAWRQGSILSSSFPRSVSISVACKCKCRYSSGCRRQWKRLESIPAVRNASGARLIVVGIMQCLTRYLIFPLHCMVISTTQSLHSM